MPDPGNGASRPDAAANPQVDSSGESHAQTDTDGAAAVTPPRGPTRLVLVRHGVTVQTGGMLSGRLPGIDLTDEGVAQARRAGERLAALPVAKVYASPIERTMQTAAEVARPHSLEVAVCDGVIEAEYGEWSGQKLSDLAKTDEWKVVQAAPSRASFPGGESLREMQARVVAALDALVAAHRHETIVVVSHADPIKAAIAHYTGVHLDLFQRLHVSPASITVFDFHPFGVMLVKYNDSGTLDELVPAPPANDADASSEATADA
jgi:probable phosphoglycerate mutase